MGSWPQSTTMELSHYPHLCLRMKEWQLTLSPLNQVIVGTGSPLTLHSIMRFRPAVTVKFLSAVNSDSGMKGGTAKHGGNCQLFIQGTIECSHRMYNVIFLSEVQAQMSQVKVHVSFDHRISALNSKYKWTSASTNISKSTLNCQ